MARTRATPNGWLQESARGLSRATPFGWVHGQARRDAQLAWTLPTERESGGLLDPGDIAGAEIAISANGSAFATVDTFPPAVLTAIVPDLDRGLNRFRLVIIDTDGRRSADRTVDVTV